MSIHPYVSRFGFGAVIAGLAALAWTGYGRPELLLWLANSLFLCA
jgi:hypothetical protein